MIYSLEKRPPTNSPKNIHSKIKRDETTRYDTIRHDRTRHPEWSKKRKKIKRWSACLRLSISSFLLFPTFYLSQLKSLRRFYLFSLLILLVNLSSSCHTHNTKSNREKKGVKKKLNRIAFFTASHLMFEYQPQESIFSLLSFCHTEKSVDIFAVSIPSEWSHTCLIHTLDLARLIDLN